DWPTEKVANPRDWQWFDVCHRLVRRGRACDTFVCFHPRGLFCLSSQSPRLVFDQALVTQHTGLALAQYNSCATCCITLHIWDHVTAPLGVLRVSRYCNRLCAIAVAREKGKTIDRSIR